MAGLLDLIDQLEPFDPEKHSAVDIGLGGKSSEVSMTANDNDGVAFNYPSVWFTRDGQPVPLPSDLARDMALSYEELTGKMFPRFGSIDEGVNAAKSRSLIGGATRGLLAK